MACNISQSNGMPERKMMTLAGKPSQPNDTEAQSQLQHKCPSQAQKRANSCADHGVATAVDTRRQSHQRIVDDLRARQHGRKRPVTVAAAAQDGDDRRRLVSVLGAAAGTLIWRLLRTSVPAPTSLSTIVCVHPGRN